MRHLLAANQKRLILCRSIDCMSIYLKEIIIKSKFGLFVFFKIIRSSSKMVIIERWVPHFTLILWNVNSKNLRTRDHKCRCFAVVISFKKGKVLCRSSKTGSPHGACAWASRKIKGPRFHEKEGIGLVETKCMLLWFTCDNGSH